MLIGQAAPAFQKFFRTNFMPEIDEGIRNYVIKETGL